MPFLDTILELIFTSVVSAVIGGLIVYVKRTVGDLRKENLAIHNGMQAQLRDRIVQGYNHYFCDRGWMPIYAKESMQKLYRAYHELGGNDVATKLYEQMLLLPTEPSDEDQESEMLVKGDYDD